MNKLKKLKGSNFFRLKIAYSMLLQIPIEISNIRFNEINPGLTEYEISFLRLVEQISNGTKVEISKTGTQVKFFPGVITNNYGEEFEFECNNSRSVTYYLEGIIPISFYGKESLNIRLKGITNDIKDISADTFNSVTCALLQRLVIGDKVEFNIVKRGVQPLGKGEIKFKCPIVTFLNSFDWVDEGKVKRIRGTVFTSRIPGSVSTRMIDASRGVFNNFIPDVWIAVDNYKSKDKNEISQGYGLSLHCITTNEFVFSTDIVHEKVSTDITPEDLAKKCCNSLLEEIYYSGAVDSHHQALFLILMALSTNNAVSKLKLGKLSSTTIGLIRLIYELFGVKFKITQFEQDDYDEEIEDNQEEELEASYNEDDEELKMEEEKDMQELPEKLIFSCVGIGLKNVARIEL